MDSNKDQIYDSFLIAASGASLNPKVAWPLINEYFSGISDIINGNVKKTPHDDSDKAALESLILKARSAMGDKLKREAVEKSVERYHEFRGKIGREYGEAVKVRTLSIFDEDYPEALRQINSAPLVLFVAGAGFGARTSNFAVVGTREPSNYSLSMCEKITDGLVRAGHVIVSGMALGIDSCAHSTALKNGGLTYAVVATGFDLIYPASNRKLYGDILLSGAVISECMPGEGAKKYSFVLRNRIITGLSRAVLVSGAGLKSGALISAKYAFEQSREVFAIAGDDYRADVKGCHELIKKNYAKLALNSADILDEICPQKIKKTAAASKGRNIRKSVEKDDKTVDLEFAYARDLSLSEDEKKVFLLIEELNVKNDAPPPLEMLAETAADGMKINKLLSIISGLEMKGAIIELSGKRYRINR